MRTRLFQTGLLPKLPLAISILLLTVGMCWWHLHFGSIDFGGMDGGVLIQSAWSVSQGSVPYQDIPIALPPLFFLGSGLAFSLLGPTWSALSWMLCIFTVLTFMWSFVLLERITLRPWLSLFFAFSFQAVSLMPLSWWCYNQTTSLIALLAILSAYGLTQNPCSRMFGMSIGLSLALLLLVKLNTALVLSVPLVLFLLLQRETRRVILVAMAFALACDFILLSLCHISIPLYLHCCAQFSNRVTSLGSINYYLLTSSRIEHYTSLKIICYIALISIVLIWFDGDANRKRIHTIWLYLAGGVGVVQAITNNDLKLNDSVYILLMASFVIGVRGGRVAILHRLAYLLIFAFAGLLLFMALGLGASRVSVIMTGSRFYAGNEYPTHVLENPPLFRGFTVETVLVSVLHQVEGVLGADSIGVIGPKVFFGPRLDFCYAAYGIPFPKGLPIWWEKVPSSHAGEQYPMGLPMPAFWADPPRWLSEKEPYDSRVRRFIACRFDLCIFVRGYQKIADMTFFPPNLRGYIYEHYRKIDYPNIVVFERNGLAQLRTPATTNPSDSSSAATAAQRSP